MQYGHETHEPHETEPIRVHPRIQELADAVSVEFQR
jgi:hypothetical protein